MKKLLLSCFVLAGIPAGAQINRTSGGLSHIQSDIMLFEAKQEAWETREQSATQFILKGRVIGQDTGFIRLSYTGRNGERVRDSSALENSEFKFTGEIKEPTMAWLEGNTKSRSMDDPNTTSFFLEPALMTIVLKPDHFKNAEISGSKTQDEYRKLSASKEKITAKYQKQLDSLRTEKDHEKNAEIRERLAPYFNEMRQADYAFFNKHPQSYLTAYMMRFHVSDLSLDSLQMFYDKLGETLQQTNSGRDLAEEIRKLRGGSPGSMAKDFTTTDIEGKTLSLSDFKGRYVLLDFWASWCVPCRKGNPHLKELYARYKGKGIEFIGISDDDRNHAAWKKAVEKDGLPWRHVLRGLKYENGVFDRSTDISENFGIHTLPTKILIDPKGLIIGRYGEEEAELDALLKKVFGD